jgi:hypothetical protein
VLGRVDAVAAIRAAQARRLEDETGRAVQLVLGPPLPDDEIEALQARAGAPLPGELRDVLRVTREIDGPPHQLDFTGESLDVALDDTFPHGLPIAGDGFGNFWVLDLPADGRERARVFFACHDPPVVLFQSPSLADFLHETFRMLAPPHESLVDDVQHDRPFNVWGTDHGLLTLGEALAGDADLAAFAEGFDERHTFADLRDPQVGEGFAWGRHGPRTIVVRHEELELFAITPPQKQPGWLRRRRAAGRG